MDDLERLCRSCGMCCDGTLFKGVRLLPTEVEHARRLHLPVVDEGPGFTLPCPSWQAGACATYEDRPSACRSFICRLYERHRAEGGPIEARLVAVARVRELLGMLEARGLGPARHGERSIDMTGPDAGLVMTAFTELMNRIEEDFRRA
jgi:hypothetical protein